MKYIALCLMLLSLVSCSGKTTVLLLPEDDGSVGIVEVKSEEASKIINTANSYTVVDSFSSSPAPVKEMSAEEIEKRFSEVIKAQPKKPKSFLIYFESGSTKLVGKSQAAIEGALLEIKDRQPCEISVIGHSDRMGSRNYNIKLSLKRARAVEKILRASNLEIDKIDISSHGENDPIKKTPDGVSEPLNRRVEVIVR